MEEQETGYSQLCVTEPALGSTTLYKVIGVSLHLYSHFIITNFTNKDLLNVVLIDFLPMRINLNGRH